MGDYLKRCESGRAMDDIVQLNFSKKRKLCCELEYEYHGDVETAASRTSDFHVYDESNDVVNRSLRSPDLESENFVMEVSTSINGGIFRREGTPTSEQFGESKPLLMDSSSRPKKKPLLAPVSLRLKITASTAEKMPTAAELEEFFAAAEKQDKKRFTEKYNYDVVKDVPLEGKYQWVRLYP